MGSRGKGPDEMPSSGQVRENEPAAIELMPSRRKEIPAPLSRGGPSCRKIRVGTLFTNSLRDAGPRAAGVEGRRAAQELFDKRRSFDLNMRVAQILRNRRTGGAGATLTGGTLPEPPRNDLTRCSARRAVAKKAQNEANGNRWLTFYAQRDSVRKPRSFWDRFNDGRFRVTTEAKLRPLARFGCSMVPRLISAFRAVRQPAEGGAPTNRNLKDC